MSNEVPDFQTRLALTRTAAALDTTLLAWVRTSLSLIGFGFGLAKFVHDLLLNKYLVGVDAETPRVLGLGMMMLGVLSLVGGALEHVRCVKRLQMTTATSAWSAAFIVTLVMAIIGVLLVLSLLVKSGGP
jgi:putative membrane protein